MLRRLAPVLAAVLLLTACTDEPEAGPPAGPAPAASSPAGVPTAPTAQVCDRAAPGPATAPPGAVTVDPAEDAALTARTNSSPPGTTFWLAPGVHTLGTDQYGQVKPKDGDVYIGAPGAVLDGRGLNRFAFIGEATNVTISHLTVRGFVPPQDQGVVNHDSGNGWTIADNTIEKNRGAGLMAGADQKVLRNCLRDNGQYGMNAYQAGNRITKLTVEGNEIVGNNADDWETRNPGCGCSGGVKFWAVNGADVRDNWVHDNKGVALWADTNNNDFLVERNVIENNAGQAVFYEISYNMVLRDNLIRGNAMASGRAFAARKDNFPEAAVYLSEAGGDSRLPARTDKIDIYDNLFVDNWSGITAWENADRFCNSPANTSTGECTPFVAQTQTCSQPAIATPPLYNDCRWRTQRLDVHANTFVAESPTVACAPGFASRMAILSNFGTYPDWSPYKGDVVQQSIVRNQDIRWSGNTYRGAWTFVLGDVGHAATQQEWQGSGSVQDADSTFTGAPTATPC